MAKSFEFLFDYGSPFSYLANIQTPRFARRAGASVIYRPILLGAVLKATGNSSPMTVPAKARYMGDDLRRWASRYGVEFRINPYPFLRNTLNLMRAAVAAQKLGSFNACHEAVFPAIWADGLDLGDSSVLGVVLRRAGVDAQALLAAAETPEVKDELRRNTEYAVSRGVFGAPSFLVGDELYWGNDRFDFIAEALGRIA